LKLRWHRYNLNIDMKVLLGTKQNMTQIFNDEGIVTPVTVISAGPMTAVQVKTKDKDGYESVQFGFGDRNEKNIKKAQKGSMKDLGLFKWLREFKAVDGNLEVGSKLDVSTFTEGDVVAVSGISKGKGFQGVVKRHGFAGGRRTHGQKHSEREPGSIGAGGMQRVFKGLRMAGRMGSDRITVKNLKVIRIDAEKNKIYISGAIPGRKGTLLEIRG